MEKYLDLTDPYIITNPYRDLIDPMLPDIKLKHGTYAEVRNSNKNPKIQRNSPCPCGSGKKYKNCCSQ